MTKNPNWYPPPTTDPPEPPPAPPPKKPDLPQILVFREGAEPPRKPEPRPRISDRQRQAMFAAECERMRKKSGEVRDRRPLVSFLYSLGKRLAPGEIEQAIDDATFPQCEVLFCNGWLARWAQDAAERLTGEIEPPEIPEDEKRSHET